MMSSKTDLSLYQIEQNTTRVVYQGQKSVAAFKLAKNNRIIVTQNYIETAILEE